VTATWDDIRLTIGGVELVTKSIRYTAPDGTYTIQTTRVLDCTMITCWGSGTTFSKIVSSENCLDEALVELDRLLETGNKPAFMQVSHYVGLSPEPIAWELQIEGKP
jgi:hypothetical protein